MAKTVPTAETKPAEENKPLVLADVVAENVKLKKEVAELTAKLAVKTAAINVKGFLLDTDNPYGDGVIRAYRKAGGESPQSNHLPFVLPEGEEASKAALENYLIRAAGDKERVAAIRKVLRQPRKSRSKRVKVTLCS